MSRMQHRTFQRRIEDFTCESCGAHVRGDGYTNHCPECLVSKHVDMHPGDRASSCGGLMDVVDIAWENGEPVLTHACRICAHTKRNKVQVGDHTHALIQLMEQRANSLRE